jgi:hypothetical protein
MSLKSGNSADNDDVRGKTWIESALAYTLNPFDSTVISVKSYREVVCLIEVHVPTEPDGEYYKLLQESDIVRLSSRSH